MTRFKRGVTISYSGHKVILCRKIQIGVHKGNLNSGLEGNIIMLYWRRKTCFTDGHTIDAFASKDIPHWACTIENSVRKKKSFMKALPGFFPCSYACRRSTLFYETLLKSESSDFQLNTKSENEFCCGSH